MNPTVSQLTYHVQAALERLLRLAGGRSAWGSRGQFMDAMVEAMVGVEALVGAINAFYEVPGPTFAMCARARVNLIIVAEPPTDEEAFDAFAEYVCAVATGADLLTLAQLVARTENGDLERRLARHLDFSMNGVRSALLSTSEGAVG